MSDIKAFPLHEDATASKDMQQQGMTLRDYFAAKALSGLLSNPKVQEKDDAWGIYSEMANWAYMLADAMLEERENKKE